MCLCHPLNVEIHFPGQAIEGSFKTEGLCDQHDHLTGTVRLPADALARAPSSPGPDSEPAPGEKRGGPVPLRLVTMTARPITLPVLSGSYRAGQRCAMSRPPQGGLGEASVRINTTRHAFCCPSGPVVLGERWHGSTGSPSGRGEFF